MSSWLRVTSHQLSQNLRITLSMKDQELIHVGNVINIHESITKLYCNWKERNDIMDARLGEQRMQSLLKP